MGLSTLIDGAYESYGPARKNQLIIQKEINFPLQEISGLYLKQRENNLNPELFFVGDRKATLGISFLENGKLKKRRMLDFSRSIVQKYGICKSVHIPACKDYLKTMTTQWEAVASDASGRVFLLHEQLATIFVYNIVTNSIERLINLDRFELQPKKQSFKSHSSKDNAMAEGFVLLKNGHILVIKERQKTSLIEFGPPGATPQGYRPDLPVGSRDEYPLAEETINLIPLKIWYLEQEYKSCDLSELNTDAQGELYILSQRCNWIAALKHPRASEDKMRLRKTWALPTKIRKAEAFVVLPQKTFIVAEDRKSTNKKNVFILSEQKENISQKNLINQTDKNI